MTTDPSGPARPGRLVGLALMGVAAVAAVIGVVTLVGGNGDTSAEPAPSTTATAPAPPSGDLTSLPAATTPTAEPTSSSVAPTTTQAPVTTTTTVAPAPPATSAAPPAGGAPTTRSEPVRVYNNSFIRGLAEDAGRDLAARGWTVAETGNYSGGKIPTTTVYFQPGSGQEAAAQELAAELGIRSEARFDGIEGSSPGLILIVTQDYKGPKDK